MSKLSFLFSLLALVVCARPARAQSHPDANQPSTIAEKTAGAQKLPGYFNLYWDAKQGKLWLEVDTWSRALYLPVSAPMTSAWTAASWARRVSCASSAAAQRFC